MGVINTPCHRNESYRALLRLTESLRSPIKAFAVSTNPLNASIGVQFPKARLNGIKERRNSLSIHLVGRCLHP